MSLESLPPGVLGRICFYCGELPPSLPPEDDNDAGVAVGSPAFTGLRTAAALGRTSRALRALVSPVQGDLIWRDALEGDLRWHGGFDLGLERTEVHPYVFDADGGAREKTAADCPPEVVAALLRGHDEGTQEANPPDEPSGLWRNVARHQFTLVRKWTSECGLAALVVSNTLRHDSVSVEEADRARFRFCRRLSACFAEDAPSDRWHRKSSSLKLESAVVSSSAATAVLSWSVHSDDPDREREGMIGKMSSPTFRVLATRTARHWYPRLLGIDIDMSFTSQSPVFLFNASDFSDNADDPAADGIYREFHGTLGEARTNPSLAGVLLVACESTEKEDLHAELDKVARRLKISWVSRDLQMCPFYAGPVTLMVVPIKSAAEKGFGAMRKRTAWTLFTWLRKWPSARPHFGVPEHARLATLVAGDDESEDTYRYLESGYRTYF